MSNQNIGPEISKILQAATRNLEIVENSQPSTPDTILFVGLLQTSIAQAALISTVAVSLSRIADALEASNQKGQPEG